MMIKTKKTVKVVKQSGLKPKVKKPIVRESESKMIPADNLQGAVKFLVEKKFSGVLCRKPSRSLYAVKYFTEHKAVVDKIYTAADVLADCSSSLKLIGTATEAAIELKTGLKLIPLKVTTEGRKKIVSFKLVK